MACFWISVSSCWSFSRFLGHEATTGIDMLIPLNGMIILYHRNFIQQWLQVSLTVCHHLHICTATSSLSRCKICQEEIFNALCKKFSLLSKINIFPIVDKSKHTGDEWKIILTLFSQVLFAPISCASVHNFDQYRPSNSLALLLLSVAQGRASERGIRRPKVWSSISQWGL